MMKRGVVNLDAHKVPIRLPGGHGDQAFAVAEADLEYDRGVAAEQRLEVERLVGVLDTVFRP